MGITLGNIGALPDGAEQAQTAHVAWEKGAEYFGVKAVHAPLDDDWRVDAGAVKKLVNRNT
ncbi:MAG: hypothetical protein WCZ16_02570, partial [Desulfosarcinaceae bacterium]